MPILDKLSWKKRRSYSVSKAEKMAEQIKEDEEIFQNYFNRRKSEMISTEVCVPI